MNVALGRRCIAKEAVSLALLGWAMFAEGAPLAENTTLRFGVIAEEANEPDRMLRVFAGLLTELRSRLAPRGIEVAPLVIAQNLAELAQKLKLGDVDMVIETMFPTLALQEQSGGALVPRLALVRRGQREYHSVFFARKTGKIKTLEDLRGRTLVLQAVRSTSAFAVPKTELAGRGIALVPAEGPALPKGGAFFVLAGAELNQAIWVLSGKGDAGAFNESDWASLPDKVRNDLVIFHETRPLLRGLLSLRSGLDQKTRKACEEVLLGLHLDAAGQAALTQAAGITRFEPLVRKDLADVSEWRLALKRAAIR